MRDVFGIQASTTKGAENTVHKSLSTCFRASRKGVKAPAINGSASTMTPSIASSRRSKRSSSVSSTSYSTNIAFPSLDNTEAINPDPLFSTAQVHRLDQHYAPVSLAYFFASGQQKQDATIY
jgi:hypothetical protein